jgi:hypothetical protein
VIYTISAVVWSVFMLVVGVYLLAVFFYWILKGNKEE